MACGFVDWFAGLSGGNLVDGRSEEVGKMRQRGPGAGRQCAEDGGGIFDLDSRGAVTLTASREHAAGPPAAEVTDALAGRPPAAAVLGALPANTRTALSHLADFFTTPVDQIPA